MQTGSQAEISMQDHVGTPTRCPLGDGPASPGCPETESWPDTRLIMLKRSTKTALWLITLCLLAGCFSFRPGFSMSDKEYFQDSPCIVIHASTYALRWRY